MIDMNLWMRAFNELREAVQDIETSPATREKWVWIREHYTAALVAYSQMTPEQQATLDEPLETLRKQLERLAQQDVQQRTIRSTQ